jgi:hypothetical protein
MSGKIRIRIIAIIAASVLAPVVGAHAQIPLGQAEGQVTPASSRQELTPENLGMPRSQISFDDRRVRLFNGRGAVSIRDKSLTGLQFLKFPPIDLRDWKFSLAFKETGANLLIQDLVPDYYEAKVQNWKNPHPLGMNFTPGLPYTVLLQQAYWEPGTYFRTGTFHKLINDRWISFGISTKTNVSAQTDEVYMEVEIENREAEPLEFLVSADQRAPDLTLTYPNEPAKPASAVTHPDAFTIASNQIRITTTSNLEQQGGEGWKWEIPGHGSRKAYFAIVLQKASAPAPAVVESDIAGRMDQADQALRARLEWAEQKLPHVSTADPALDDLYRRSILSVLETRWDRSDFTVRPFYAAGSWIFTIPWDTSYASEMLSVLDPEGLRAAFLTYVRAGLMTNSWVPWNGNANTIFPGSKERYWYVQNPFAEMRIIQDYLTQTGDVAFLDRTQDGATIFEWMKRMGRELEKQYARPDGLLDFGAGSQRLLEIRTDGYQHVVAASNGLAIAYFHQLAEWCRERHDPAADQFEAWAKHLREVLNQKLWDPSDGWFVNRYPDESQQLVWSYHLYDMLDAGILSPEQQAALIRHLKEGEFLAPLGMYSISKVDRVHWDLEDVDWGGGGQYTGEPLRVVESLYRLGDAELAWNLLDRCTRWTKNFPIVPQEVFGDSPQSPEAEMPLELDAGSTMGAIVFGVFGLHPHPDGSLTVSPSYHEELGQAQLTGYSFRGHSYDVRMGPWDYEVFRDGKQIARNTYVQTVVVPAGAEASVK